MTLYTKFIFGKCKPKKLRGKELHPFGVSCAPFPHENRDGMRQELAWITKLHFAKSRMDDKGRTATSDRKYTSKNDQTNPNSDDGTVTRGQTGNQTSSINGIHIS